MQWRALNGQRMGSAERARFSILLECVLSLSSQAKKTVNDGSKAGLMEPTRSEWLANAWAQSRAHDGRNFLAFARLRKGAHHLQG